MWEKLLREIWGASQKLPEGVQIEESGIALALKCDYGEGRYPWMIVSKGEITLGFQRWEGYFFGWSWNTVLRICSPEEIDQV